jgi:hypothetical protein
VGVEEDMTAANRAALRKIADDLGLDIDEAAVVVRLRAELETVKGQRERLALRLSSYSGRPWEDELEDVGVERQTPRDPNPSKLIEDS